MTTQISLNHRLRRRLKCFSLEQIFNTSKQTRLCVDCLRSNIIIRNQSSVRVCCKVCKMYAICVDALKPQKICLVKTTQNSGLCHLKGNMIKYFNTYQCFSSIHFYYQLGFDTALYIPYFILIRQNLFKELEETNKFCLRPSAVMNLKCNYSECNLLIIITVQLEYLRKVTKNNWK
jgi:hypothetical protein